ncbi:hypothetical protein FO488_06285 [Geobacter sp. FeAm09]|uniref:hypothetical protein n=1 Tax=Geobacter sp. FeAm09 TaxID=2597769 RepID=UPI0011EBCAC9|nr:hypothetical protein [Geobacter sp. FeAm09]QEM67801.1 hypothetical protein FO488_06285 [Geobacter sp. FeAm09]
MTRTRGILSVLAAAMAFSAVPLMADDYTGTTMNPDMKAMQQGQKDECLLVAMNCPTGQVDTVQQRIDRLNREIDKGNAVYTDRELQQLKEQLKWINEDSDNIYITE